MNKKVLLVDGCSILATCFFGTVPISYKTAKDDAAKDIALEDVLKTSDGVYTNAIFSFCKILDNIQKSGEFSHIAVAWDLSRETTFRRKLYAEYKVQRQATRNELSSQIVKMQQLLGYIGIVSITHEGYEADDIIGSMARAYEKDAEVAIWTKDQDQLQLISNTTTVWLITGKSEEYCKLYGNHKVPYINRVYKFDEKRFEQHYKMKPIQIIDFKALSGDASDNIPGVDGIGDKGALGIITAFGTIEKAIDFVSTATDEDIKKKKLEIKGLGVTSCPFSMFKEPKNVEIAKLCKQLTTIECGLQVPELKTLIYCPNSDKKRKIYKRLEFASLL